MSTKHSWMWWTLTVVSLLGVINAGYLSFVALSGGVPSCNFIHGCDIVARSSYSYFLGIPLSLFGVFFYFVTFGLSVWGLAGNKSFAIKLLLPVTTLGFLLSLYFLYLQAFPIGAFCEYCLFSLLDATILFVIALFLFKKRSETKGAVPSSHGTV